MIDAAAVNLHGIRVWVTRSEPQAHSLFAALRAAGAVAVTVPTLAILAPVDAAAAGSRLRALLPQADVAVFTSRNAVDWSWRLAPDAAALLESTRVVAVGPATAAGLRDRGIAHVSVPAAGADSEAVLEMPLLAAERVRGRRVVIVRGAGGRALLADTLRARGATVDYAEVYRRSNHPDTRVRLPDLWREQPPQVIVVSSPAGLRALIEMTDSGHRERLYNCPLLAIGEHLARQAPSLGFRSCHPVSAAGGDAAVLATLAKMTRNTH